MQIDRRDRPVQRLQSGARVGQSDARAVRQPADGRTRAIVFNRQDELIVLATRPDAERTGVHTLRDSVPERIFDERLEHKRRHGRLQ
jgi:hypothetical protein